MLQCLILANMYNGDHQTWRRYNKGKGGPRAHVVCNTGAQAGETLFFVYFILENSKYVGAVCEVSRSWRLHGFRTPSRVSLLVSCLFRMSSCRRHVYFSPSPAAYAPLVQHGAALRRKEQE